MNQKLGKRFNELNEQYKKICATVENVEGAFGSTIEQVDMELFLAWRVNVKNLLLKIGGNDSLHFQQFSAYENPVNRFDEPHTILKRLGAIFTASKEDFDGGYLVSLRNIVQAEVFDSQLEQAQELLKNGYKDAAAVIAGIVLETTLREFCDRHSLKHGAIDVMNCQLAKAGAYDRLQQKQITVLADIRNNAAHGKTGNFSTENVENMIRDINSFLITHLGDR